MNLELQVTSLGLSNKLKELGVKQESLFYWVLNPYLNEERYEITRFGEGYNPISISISAFTASELLELLPENYKFVKQSGKWHVITNGCLKCTGEDTLTFDDNLSNSCAKMLIYLIENNLMETK